MHSGGGLGGGGRQELVRGGRGWGRKEVSWVLLRLRREGRVSVGYRAVEDHIGMSGAGEWEERGDQA